MGAPGNARPAVIVIGGFAGAGKTSLSRRLAAELGIPRLGSDDIGEAIKGSQGIRAGVVEAYWIGYDVLFTLCEEFVRSGVSSVLDLSMGWAFQWERPDGIAERHPEALILPIILRCPKEVCIERIRQRHADDPGRPAHGEPPELSRQLLGVWAFLERLDRPEVSFVDAAKRRDEVYADIQRRIASAL